MMTFPQLDPNNKSSSSSSSSSSSVECNSNLPGSQLLHPMNDTIATTPTRGSGGGATTPSRNGEQGLGEPQAAERMPRATAAAAVDDCDDCCVDQRNLVEIDDDDDNNKSNKTWTLRIRSTKDVQVIVQPTDSVRAVKQAVVVALFHEQALPDVPAFSLTAAAASLSASTSSPAAVSALHAILKPKLVSSTPSNNNTSTNPVTTVTTSSSSPNVAYTVEALSSLYYVRLICCGRLLAPDAALLEEFNVLQDQVVVHAVVASAQQAGAQAVAAQGIMPGTAPPPPNAATTATTTLNSHYNSLVGGGNSARVARPPRALRGTGIDASGFAVRSQASSAAAAAAAHLAPWQVSAATGVHPASLEDSDEDDDEEEDDDAAEFLTDASVNDDDEEEDDEESIQNASRRQQQQQSDATVFQQMEQGQLPGSSRSQRRYPYSSNSSSSTHHQHHSQQQQPQNQRQDHSRRRRRRRLGFDRLREDAGLRRTEVAALRAYFGRAVDRWIRQDPIAAERAAAHETDRWRRRLLQEEAWMALQGPASEFRLNVQLNNSSNNNWNHPASPARNNNSSNTTTMTPTEALWRVGGLSATLGTHRDFWWGLSLGFLVGSLMLVWVWMPTVPHRQKLGILTGLCLQLVLNMLQKASIAANGGNNGGPFGGNGGFMVPEDIVVDDGTSLLPPFTTTTGGASSGST